MGFAEQVADSFGIQPWAFAGFTDELDQAPQATAAGDLRETRRFLSQNIDEMSQPHQKMISPHGVPVLREAMLVLISMTLLHQDAVLNRPAVTGAQITQFVNVVAAQRLTGDPRMA